MLSLHSASRIGVSLLVAAGLLVMSLSPAVAKTPKYDLNTLAGKVAALRGTGPLQLRFSAFIEQEANEDFNVPSPGAPITPSFVLSSPLDGNTIQSPDVTVNQDTAGAPQNETAIAVDPNNPNRIVAGANDYVTRTWTCSISGTPCSALGDGYSGTYYSNDGGSTWCCVATDPAHLGTLIPGVEHLTGGPYEAGGDPALAFDSQGHVFYAGLGFNRTSAPNTVTVSKGTFDGSGHLSWGAPTFVGATKSPSILNDKEWIAVDHNVGSPFQDRVYVTWTRYIFSVVTGAYVQSPIFFAASSDGGATFTAPKSISGSVLYGQGSRPVVGPDGSLYVFWDASKRHDALDSTWFVKSTDGGATWSAPRAIAKVADSLPLFDTAFRVNSFPAAAAAPNGDLYAVWTTEVPNDGTTYNGTNDCAYWLTSRAHVYANCHSAAVWSTSTDGGATWSAPTAAFIQGASRVAVGYPVTQPSDGSTLNAPAARPVEDIFPAVTVAPNGRVYVGAYRGDVVSPWQACASGPVPPVGRIACDELGDYIHNTRLDYLVTDLTTDTTNTMSTHPINTRNGFGGGFFGDYTDIAAGSDNVFHALWTDSNNKQSVVWFYGYEFTPTSINQEDIATASGNF